MDDSHTFDDDVSDDKTDQMYRKIDLKSLPKGICKVASTESRIRISTHTCHYFFNKNGSYTGFNHRTGTKIALMGGFYLGHFVVAGVYIFDASIKTCREVAISVLKDRRLAEVDDMFEWPVC